jgi:hypothetical protein
MSSGNHALKAVSLFRDKIMEFTFLFDEAE